MPHNSSSSNEDHNVEDEQIDLGKREKSIGKKRNAPRQASSNRKSSNNSYSDDDDDLSDDEIQGYPQLFSDNKELNFITKEEDNTLASAKAEREFERLSQEARDNCIKTVYRLILFKGQTQYYEK